MIENLNATLVPEVAQEVKMMGTGEVLGEVELHRRYAHRAQLEEQEHCSLSILRLEAAG